MTTSHDTLGAMRTDPPRMTGTPLVVPAACAHPTHQSTERGVVLR